MCNRPSRHAETWKRGSINNLFCLHDSTFECLAARSVSVRRFHHALWGWTFEAAFADTDLNADYWIIRSSDNGIGGLQRSASSARPHAGTRLYVEAADLEETLGRVQALGGRVERGRTALGGDNRWFATVLDPTGVALACGLHAQPWQLSPTTTLTHRIGLRTACPDRPPRTFIQVRPTCGKCGWF
jgi:predicted enzyme related to lactoylglutathione lyase